jgi:hypothetical protein
MFWMIVTRFGSALTETENWDLLVDCTNRDGRQMLDAGVHLSDKCTLLMKTHIPFQTQYNIFYPNPLLHQIFLQNRNTARFSLYTKSRNIFFKKIFSPFIKSVFDFFITLEMSETRQDKLYNFLYKS